LLDDRDFAYLIDFGIARVADDTRMTKTGNTIGTFAYIAPERLDLKGDEDARVDIYSLACVLYECLTGEPPFNADTMPRLIVAHMSTPPPRPSITRPEVPAQVDEVIATGMAKDPEQRYATTIELADAPHEAITTAIERPTPRPAPGPTLLDNATRPDPTREPTTPTRPTAPTRRPPATRHRHPATAAVAPRRLRDSGGPDRAGPAVHPALLRPQHAPVDVALVATAAGAGSHHDPIDVALVATAAGAGS
jgi:serine/threonine protein kinase